MRPPDCSGVLSRRNIDLLPHSPHSPSLRVAGPRESPHLANQVSKRSPHSRLDLGRLGSAPIQPFPRVPSPFQVESRCQERDDRNITGQKKSRKREILCLSAQGRTERKTAGRRPLHPRARSPAAAGLSARRAPGPRPAFPPGDRPARGPGTGTRLEGAARRRRAGRPRPSTPGRRTGVGRAPRTAPRSARPAARAAIVSAPLPRAGLAPPRPAPLAPRRLALPCTHLRRRLPVALRTRGLVASGGGGASGPSDHLWKRRGGGCLLVQLQPTSGSYFGAPAAPRLQPNGPPRGWGAGQLAGTPGWRGRAAGRGGVGARARGCGPSPAGSPAAGGTASPRRPLAPLAFALLPGPVPASPPHAQTLPSVFSLDKRSKS